MAQGAREQVPTPWPFARRWQNCLVEPPTTTATEPLNRLRQTVANPKSPQTVPVIGLEEFDLKCSLGRGWPSEHHMDRGLAMKAVLAKRTFDGCQDGRVIMTVRG